MCCILFDCYMYNRPKIQVSLKQWGRLINEIYVRLQLQYEVGKCGSLYNSLDVAITAGCESFLNPWVNSFHSYLSFNL